MHHTTQNRLLEPATTDTRHIKLSELTGSIRRMFQHHFGGRHFLVVAEISDHKYYASKGHRYLSLVEKNPDNNEILAKVSAVAWRRGSDRIRQFEQQTGQAFQDGISVMVMVSVDYSPQYGLKLTIEDISTEYTIGLLEQQRQATLARLLEECCDCVCREGGEIITSNKRLSYNTVIQRIAVVSSSSAAGYHDFQHTLDGNGFGYRFAVDTYFTSVQGEASGPAICDCLDCICAGTTRYDAVVIIRGGGAQTDFLVFDSFEICKRIAAMPFPVITGIGHTKDQTLSDLMASTPVKTPTKAAEHIIAHNRSFEDTLIRLRNNIVIRTQNLLAAHNENLNHIKQLTIRKPTEMVLERRRELFAISNLLTTKPVVLVNRNRDELKMIAAAMAVNTRKYFNNQKSYLGHFDAVCRMMSPVNILKKGFAIIYQGDHIVPDGNAITEGAEIRIRMADVEIAAKTKTIKQIDGNEFDL